MEEEHRDTPGLIRRPFDVKDWCHQPPDVALARPAACPWCHAASAPPGGPLGLHGHGTRERCLRGLLTHDGPVDDHALRLRRYRCTTCQHTCTVAPVELLPRRHFSAVSIALALALFGVVKATLAAIHGQLNPARVRGPSARGWRAVGGWIAAVTDLFPCVRPAPTDWTPRQIAERAAMTLTAYALDPEGSIPRLATRGACRVR